MQLRLGRRDRDPEKYRAVTPHLIVTVARGPEVSKVRSITQLCWLSDGEMIHGPKMTFAMQALPALRPHRGA